MEDRLLSGTLQDLRLAHGQSEVVGCQPQKFRADHDMAGYSSLLVPHGTRTEANGKVLLPDAS